MSTEEKPDLVRGWLYVEDLLAQDEAERIAKLSEAELDEELRAKGVDPARVPSGQEFLARAAAKAAARESQKAAPLPAAPSVPAPIKVVPLARPVRPWRVVWLAAAAVVLLFGALAVTEGAAIVAWLRGDKVEPILPDNEKPRPLPPREVAEKLRDEADKACVSQVLGTCRDKLDEAQKLDPAGEAEDRVQRMRAVIRDSWRVEPPKDKPGR